ncbi:MAG: glycosyltransferase, partial [Thiopseudomonas sp.]|nr:glycosyltransferase [Thiopseudomonas sp.]
PLLYAGAAVFAYPSVYEGFGLPVLEAMASGVKVICARDSAMAEFAFDGACLNDPSSCEELAFALQRELESTVSGKLVENQVHSFTWQACAEKTLAIYQQIQ